MYYEEVLKYLYPCLLCNISLKAYSNEKVSVFKANNIFTEAVDFECGKFSIYYKNIHPQEKDNQKHLKTINSINFLGQRYLPTVSKLVYVKGDKILLKRNIIPDFYLFNLFNQFTIETINRQTGYECILQSIDIQILILLLRIISKNFKDKKSKIYFNQEITDRIMKRLINFRLDDLIFNEKARQVSYSRYHHTINCKKLWSLFKYSDQSLIKLCFKIDLEEKNFILIYFK